MVQKRYWLRPPQLTVSEREHVYDNACSKVSKYFFDPQFRGVDWRSIVEQRRANAVARSSPEEFEAAVHDTFRMLGTSHTGFFHQSVRRVPCRLAVGATCTKNVSGDTAIWMILDVHRGGPADVGGLRPGDELHTINGRPVAPPEQPMVPMGAEARLGVRRDGQTIELILQVPAPRSRKQPYTEPENVTYTILADGTGYLKVSIFPGLIGIDVAQEIDNAFSALRDCDRLVLDLRGHMGGGLGVLRLMSHLTPHRCPIGYTFTRKAAERGWKHEDLPRFDRLPRSKMWGIAALALKFGLRDQSVLLVSEGLGAKRCHGRIIILTNEWTVSAGEMVCAFAQELKLATLVGTETAGRLIPGSGFKVGHGYMAIFPKAAYITAGGSVFEGQGITPDLFVPWSFEEYRAGRDNQLETALQLLRDNYGHV